MIITLNFATPSEQNVDWGNNINFMFTRGQKFATPSEQYVGWGTNINYISMRDQHSPLPMNNMLVGVMTSSLSSQGIKIRHPYEQYVDWGVDINFIFIATWSQARRNVRVAANMFKQCWNIIAGYIPDVCWWHYDHYVSSHRFPTMPLHHKTQVANNIW